MSDSIVYFVGSDELPEHIIERYHNINNIKCFEKIKIQGQIKCVAHFFDNSPSAILSNDNFEWIKYTMEVVK